MTYHLSSSPLRRARLGLLALALLGAAALALAPPAAAGEALVYEADISSLNHDVVGANVFGKAVLTLRGDELTMELRMHNLPPGTHLAHLHGRPDGEMALCLTRYGDANGDGVLDLLETQKPSGKTMIPFHDDPVSLKIKGEGYPQAGPDGEAVYKKTVSWSALQKAVKDKFGVAPLELDQVVIYVHGVPAEAKLPDSAGSLPGVPAHVTLPVACGRPGRVD